MKTTQLIAILTLFSCTFSSFAQTQYKAGSIHVQQLGTTQVNVYVELITDQAANVDSINLCYGDGTCEWLQPVQQQVIQNTDATIYNFTSTHTYEQASTYKISFSDCCWNDQGLNTVGISDSTFQISNKYSLVDPATMGTNSSPVGYQPNIDAGEVNQPLVYSHNFYDANGDSTVVSLVAPSVDGYQFPDEIEPGPDNLFQINNQHVVTWESPQLAGEYHFVYKVSEYRWGTLLSSAIGVTYIDVRNLTSLTELSNQPYSLSPNPVTEELFINGEEYDRALVYNTQGNLLITKDGARERSINLSALPSGVYLVVLLKGQSRYVSKIVKK